jgi:cytoskeletal protein CcmA (bactofilin family)
MNPAGNTHQGGQGRSVNGSGAGARENVPAPAAPDAAQMSVIGADILITGNIEAEVDLHIEGRVQGDVRCATLILGESSSVVGSIFAERVRVSGQVDGSIETTDLAVEGSARVKGEVTYSRLRIGNGGVIEGTMTHKPIDDSAHLKLVDDPETEPSPAKVHYIE